MTITVAPRSVQTRAMGQATVLMRRGGGLTAAAAALVTPYVAGTDTPYALPLYAGPDASTPLVFPVATGEDGVVELWADAAARLDVEAVHPTWGANRVTLDLEWPPDAVAAAGDAYTKTESDARYPLKTDPDPYPVYATDAGLAAVQAELAAVYTEAEADARFEHQAEKGQPNGYAPLDAGALVPTAHLPPLAVNEVFVVASQAAMLALDAQVGDMAVRTDSGLTYVLAADPPATLANWKEVLAAGQVQSVNGETGVVSLSAADVGAAAADHTHPSEESGQWRFQNNPTIADPGSGYMRGSTGVLSTSTTLAFSRTTQDGYDIPPPGWGVAAGDTIYIQDRDDSTRWVRYTANEPLSQFATYATGVVTVVGSAGTIPHGTIVQATFSLAGGGGGGGGSLLATDVLADAKGDLAASADDAIGRLPLGTNGHVLTADATQALGVTWAAAAGVVGTSSWVSFVIDGGGTAITTGQKGHFAVPAGEIVEVVLLADASGSIVLDLWRDTYANYPPVVADSICGGAKPTLSSTSKAQDVTLTGWSTTVAEGDIIAVNVDSAATIVRLTLAVRIVRS